MRAKQQRLYINIDHVATLRQARRAAEPDPVAAARMCEDAGANGITAHLRDSGEGAALEALRDAARRGADLGIAIHAGHGLTVTNVGPVARIPEIEELNIGHSIISRSVFIGLEPAVMEMHEAMRAARSS